MEERDLSTLWTRHAQQCLHRRGHESLTDAFICACRHGPSHSLERVPTLGEPATASQPPRTTEAYHRPSSRLTRRVQLWARQRKIKDLLYIFVLATRTRSPAAQMWGTCGQDFDIKVLGNNFLWHFARNISHCLEQNFCNEFSHLLIPTQVLISLRTNKSPFRAIMENMLPDLLPSPSRYSLQPPKPFSG